MSGGALTYFVTGDKVLFDATGAANPVVNLVGSLNPSNTVVDAATSYVFTGAGTLDGTGGLTKNNSGTLTILTANNNYPGSTLINGGTLEATNLANGGVASSIGASFAAGGSFSKPSSDDTPYRCSNRPRPTLLRFSLFSSPSRPVTSDQ